MRLQSIDILKLFAMFLVVWGHCVQFLLTSYYLDEPVYLYIYSFHMPLFVMISGMFVRRFSPAATDKWLSLSRWREGGKYILVKMRQLLLPCLSWGVLMSAANLLQPLLVGTHAELSLWGTLWNNFWFLKSLFVCFLLWTVSHLLLRREWLAVTVSLVAGFFVIEWQVQWMYPAFVVGAVVGRHLDAFRRYRVPVAVGGLLLGALLLLRWDASCFFIPSVYRFFDGSGVDVWQAVGMRLYRLAVNGSISIGLIAAFLGLEAPLSLRIDRSSVQPVQSVGIRSVLSVLAGWGTLTLGIYIIHSLVFVVRARLFPSFLCCDALNPWLFNIAIAPLLAGMLLAVSVGVTKIISRLPWLSFFLLGTPLSGRQ